MVDNSMKAVIVLTGLFVLSSASPQTQFIKSSGLEGTSSGEWPYSLIQSTDGGYVAAGAVEGGGLGGINMLLSGFDRAGNCQWTRIAGTSDWEWARSIIQTEDGGYLAVGEGTELLQCPDCVLLTKFDATWNLEWSRLFGSLGTQADAYDVVQTLDGGYAVVGTADQAGAPMCFLAKFDASGNSEWARVARDLYGGKARAYSLVQRPDGRFLMAGSDSTTDWNGAAIFMAEADGRILNCQLFRNMGSFRSIVRTADGGHALAGNTSFSDTLGDFLLVKIGSGLWSHEWTSIVGGDSVDRFESFVQTSDSGYILAGYTESYAGSGEPGGILLTRLTSSGTHDWSKFLKVGEEDNSVASVLQTSDGGCVIAGNDGLSYVDDDVLLAKFDSFGRSCAGDSVEPSVTGMVPLQSSELIVDAAWSVDVHEVTLSIIDTVQATTVVCMYPLPNLVGDCESEMYSGLGDWTNDDSLTMMYDDGAHGDDVAGDDVYSSIVEAALDDFPLTLGAGHQAVGVSGEWSPQFPGQNVPVEFAVDDTITFYLDKNQYSDGFVPESCIVYNSWMSEYAWPGPYYVVGSCQYEFGASSDWSSSDTTMKMNDYGVDGDVAAGDLVFTYRGVCSTAGSYEFKVLNSYNSWQPQYALEGFVWDWGNNLSFQTAEDGFLVTFETDVAKGRTRVIAEAADGFIRGDAAGDSTVEMSDAIFTLKYLYVPGADQPPCMDAADSDDGGAVEMSDAIYTLKYLYVPGAPPPPDPGPVDCGSDPTEDGLDCYNHPCQPFVARFVRGDCNGDMDVTQDDLDYLSDWHFGVGPAPECLDAADVDDDGLLNVADIVYLDDYINSGWPTPPPPFPLCGPDPTGDPIGCASHPCMGGR